MTKGWFFGNKADPEHAGEHGKFHTSSSLLPFSWEQVVIAFWLRYPSPYSLHVLSEDVIARYVTDDKKLVTKRLLTKTNRIPKWGERFVRGPQHVFVVEESVVDLKDKSLVTYNRNIGYTKVMTVDEKCLYRPAVLDKALNTEMTRFACIESHLFGFSKPIQAFGVERYKRNTTKTVDGFIYVLEHLFPSVNSQDKDKVQEPLSSRIAALSSRADSFRDTAKRATDLAKLKTSDFLHSSATPAKSNPVS